MSTVDGRHVDVYTESSDGWRFHGKEPVSFCAVAAEHDEAHWNGYQLVTRPHDDDECALHDPRCIADAPTSPDSTNLQNRRDQ